MKQIICLLFFFLPLTLFSQVEDSAYVLSPEEEIYLSSKILSGRTDDIDISILTVPDGNPLDIAKSLWGTGVTTYDYHAVLVYSKETEYGSHVAIYGVKDLLSTEEILEAKNLLASEIKHNPDNAFSQTIQYLQTKKQEQESSNQNTIIIIVVIIIAVIVLVIYLARRSRSGEYGSSCGFWFFGGCGGSGCGGGCGGGGCGA